MSIQMRKVLFAQVTRKKFHNTQEYGELSFKHECIRKFGEKHGDQVWDALNRVFRLLPGAAVIDGTIFCAHGGIPRYGTAHNKRQAITQRTQQETGNHPTHTTHAGSTAATTTACKCLTPLTFPGCRASRACRVCPRARSPRGAAR